MRRTIEKIIVIMLCLFAITACAWLDTIGKALPSSDKTTGHGNNNKVLVGDNSTNFGTKSIDTDDVKGDVSGRDKYSATNLSIVHEDKFWYYLLASFAGAFCVILTRLAFLIFSRRSRIRAAKTMKKTIKARMINKSNNNNR